MRNLPFALALCLPLCAAGSMSSSALADEDACTGMPEQAAHAIPAPLGKWAQIICTADGQIITGHDGWVWYDPEDHAFVAISSRISNDTDSGPLPATEPVKSYFTKIEARRGSGEDFDKAYQAFHAGFNPHDGKPAGYRLDVTTMNGKSMTMYLFDYISYGWAIICRNGECNSNSRFLVMNMTADLKPLPPAI